MLVEHNGDLFNCPHHMSLGHAVSEDFSMHRGLAREFRARYENVDFLKAQRMPVGTCAVLPLGGRYIFYLVTKSRFYNKPTYKSVRDAFQYLKHLLDELELTQIALPGYVCCGLDKLNWMESAMMHVRTWEKSPKERKLKLSKNQNLNWSLGSWRHD